MKKRNIKLLSLITTAFVTAQLLIFNSVIISGANTVQELADYINARPGLTATVSGSQVVVDGTQTGSSSLSLNIDGGVDVIWNATLAGAVTTNNYLLTLSGSGKFVLNGSLINSGSGGTVYITDGINFNVNATGLADNPGAGSAITIAAGVQNARIDILGGTVRSVPNGYAINDGAGMSASNNNTEINIHDGLVEAGSACAIRSTGIGSVVSIMGGTVVNAAASNTNSTIYMNYAPAPNNNLYNICVYGGTVKTTNPGNQSYVIQTSQNVYVNGGSVESLAGRAINLVGMYSVAQIQDGKVSTETGTAISTATTTLDDIVNARVIISGGIVEATGKDANYSGTAVRITGTNNTVNISDSAVVTAKSGLAVDASGRPQTNSVTISGGFVLAWGNAINKVVSPIGKLERKDEGVVVAWDTSDGKGIYLRTSETDLITDADVITAFWDNEPTYAENGGIRYGSEFFKLAPDVSVFQSLYTLTVINSTKGDYVVEPFAAGTPLTITAKDEEEPQYAVFPYPPIDGNRFVGWSAVGVTLADPSLKTVSFSMPSGDVTIIAEFKPRYRFDIYGGVIADDPLVPSSFAYYSEGDIINISCTNPYPPSPIWNFGSHLSAIDNDNNSETTFTMPAGVAWAASMSSTPSIIVEETKSLTVIDGIITTTVGGIAVNSNTHECYSGTGMRILADEPPAGYEFSHWETTPAGIEGGALFDALNPSTIFTMPTPNQDVTIQAIFEHKTYVLEVDSSGSGVYSEFPNQQSGDKVEINAAPPPEGMRFSGWTIDGGGGEFEDVSSMTTDFIMSDSNAAVSAHYEWDYYILIVENGVDGLGAGRYHFGESIPIMANEPPLDMTFFNWTTNSGGYFGRQTDADTVFSMPAGDVTVTANYLDPMSPDSTDPSYPYNPSNPFGTYDPTSSSPVNTPESGEFPIVPGGVPDSSVAIPGEEQSPSITPRGIDENSGDDDEPDSIPEGEADGNNVRTGVIIGIIPLLLSAIVFTASGVRKLNRN